MIDNNCIDEAKLNEICEIDNLFDNIDYRVYAPMVEGVIPQQQKKLTPMYS